MNKKLHGLILILSGIIIIISKYLPTYQTKINEQKQINYFFEESKNTNLNKEEYVAILEIPKISLKKGLYSLKSSLNNVDKNIEILRESDMPDISYGNFILASHSGTSSISYFKNLSKLNIGDDAIIYYEKDKYVYKLVNIYKVEKIGSIEIIRNQNRKTLTMITCDQNDKTKQIVYILELDYIEEY